MIPFKDENPSRTIPFVTIGLIVINTIVFFIELFHPDGMQVLVYRYGAIPKNLLDFSGQQFPSAYLRILSSMFMHGGFFHIIGNMLYLWIFGNNIEDRLGHFRFIGFYLTSGVVAAMAHAVSAPSSEIPMIGASGAIAGILGAYLLLYPRARIHTLIFFGFFIEIIRIPAFVVIGFWGIIQIFNGIMSKGLMAETGVAWFAHIGGFLFGLLTIKLWVPKRRFR